MASWSAAGRQNGAPRGSASGVAVDQTGIGGTVVNSNSGKAEAGVWVIVETKSLPAPFRKIVVTDVGSQPAAKL